MTQYRSLFFSQGDVGRRIVDRITRAEGVLVRGATDSTIRQAARRILAEHVGEHPGEGLCDDPPWCARDDHAELTVVTEYPRRVVLSWNSGLGYVSLTEVIPDPARLTVYRDRVDELAATCTNPQSREWLAGVVADLESIINDSR